jgi:hypothetical protein
MADEPVTDPDEPPEVRANDLFADISVRFIEPEVAHRREEGGMGADELVSRYRAAAARRAPVIRLNAEVRGRLLASGERSLASNAPVVSSSSR